MVKSSVPNKLAGLLISSAMPRQFAQSLIMSSMTALPHHCHLCIKKSSGSSFVGLHSRPGPGS